MAYDGRLERESAQATMLPCARFSGSKNRNRHLNAGEEIRTDDYRDWSASLGHRPQTQAIDEILVTYTLVGGWQVGDGKECAVSVLRADGG